MNDGHVIHFRELLFTLPSVVIKLEDKTPIAWAFLGAQLSKPSPTFYTVYHSCPDYDFQARMEAWSVCTASHHTEEKDSPECWLPSSFATATIFLAATDGVLLTWQRITKPADPCAKHSMESPIGLYHGKKTCSNSLVALPDWCSNGGFAVANIVAFSPCRVHIVLSGSGG